MTNEERDHWLAEEVMGWELDEYGRWTKKHGDEKGLVIPPYFWQPTERIEQAMMVLDRLKEERFSVKYHFLENLGLQALLEEDGFRVERSWWFFFIANRPLAICRAVEAAWGR